MKLRLGTIIRLLLASALWAAAFSSSARGEPNLSGAWSERRSQLPLWSQSHSAPSPDWLINDAGYRAGVFRGARSNELVLANGLVARTFLLAPNAATIGLDNLVNHQAVIRGVKPEAILELDGVRYEIGGLKGQPNYAFLNPEWIDRLRTAPEAFRFTGFHVGAPAERFPWKRVRHAAPDSQWPPSGTYLRLDFQMPPADVLAAQGPPPPSDSGRRLLFQDDFLQKDSGWSIHISRAHARSSFQNEGKLGEVYTPANTAVYAERSLPQEARLIELSLDPGTDNSASWGPGLALIGKDGTLKFHLRPGGSQDEQGPQFGILAAGHETLISGKGFGLKTTRPVTLRLRWTPAAVLCEFRQEGEAWRTVRSLPLDSIPEGPYRVRIGKMDRNGGAGDFSTPGELVRTRVMHFATYSEAAAPQPSAESERSRAIAVSVHYELYDGIPAYSKWLTVSNGTGKALRVDRFSSEILAAVERVAEVDELTAGRIPPALHVETDHSFGGMMAAGANRRSVRWLPDPEYHSQVNYEKKTPCLLDVGPDLGPAALVQTGETFETFRAFVLLHDGEDRERNGLALRRMYRKVAPWVTENPLMMHVRFADWPTVTNAVAQCADLGFEMVILTFGSGFEVENEKPQTIEYARRLSEFARGKGLEIGTYSLLASRSISPAHDVVMPPGEKPAFGNSPCIGSAWGTNYFRRLYEFYTRSGFTLLEHDGSYPGDVCASTNHPAHRALADSRWSQWHTISDFYRWCRTQGHYLNVPDHYFLSGSSKTGMGYREVNWSLPRAQQVIHTRQNIYDGTWEKTPSMGWMFVPLTEYQGGGAAATIEPLDEHLDHYESMLVANLALGVQACYRGPRLYDTPRTRDMLKRWIDWFKAHRDILESDLVHGRRADSRDLDWMLHVNPRLKQKGMLVVFNPLKDTVEKTLSVDLYYTGLDRVARVREREGEVREYGIGRNYTVQLPVRVAGQGMSWYLIE